MKDVRAFWLLITQIIINNNRHNQIFCPKAGFSLRALEPRLQSCRSSTTNLGTKAAVLQVLHHKLRNLGCSPAGPPPQT